MDAVKLSFLLLLLLPAAECFVDDEGTIEKTIGKEPDFTPICTNTTQDIIVLIVCKIRTERSGGEECRLTYRYGHDFIHECDSRFTLTAENQTVFLHLSSLTPADSGTHTCECSKAVGTFIYHLNITVRGSDISDIYSDAWEDRVPFTMIIISSAATVVIISLVLLGFLRHRQHHGCCSSSATSGSSVRRSSAASLESNPDDNYESLERPTQDLYQTISISHQRDAERNSAISTETVHLEDMETDTSCQDYENIYLKRQTE
ncbi:uncharacterized protein LOC112451306 [Kryptolebias marmoratus]|uniref:uncharacterized protein LOC112451306 n=1 Tax=Kryptolebias marmoratus TaxID=37003 RepID=UPI0018ACB3FA|nr:uncharacterized protein LOC112451306 [Kryptolebias marmoratus]